MPDITIDFESYYDADYSLRKMTTREYIMDERFEVHLLSVIEDDKPTLVLEADEINDWVADQDWDTVSLNAHNMIFDGAILAWHYGVRPKLYECTMSMAQALVGHRIGSASLYEVNKSVGLIKDSGALYDMKGKRLRDIDRESPEWARYKVYAADDALHSRMHLLRFRKEMPPRQRLVIDTLMRMYIDSDLRLDKRILEENLVEARLEREQLLRAAGVTSKSDLTSAPKFAKLLEGLGVTPPRKISPTTKKETWAFSKKDLDFVDLMTHEKKTVRMLVEARLNASSSIEETRTVRFIRLANIEGATLNVPLRFAGAHTMRFSGMDSLNLQNLKRDSRIREAMVAPPGYVMVVVDASQIEARILAWLAGQMELLRQFGLGQDVYSAFATKVYKREINKADNPAERFVGKTGVLGLGYMTGFRTLYKSLVLGGADDMTLETSREIVNTYRTSYPEIPELWKRADEFIQSMLSLSYDKVGPLETNPGPFRTWQLPGGLPVVYPSLSLRPDDKGYPAPHYWRHRYKAWTSLYGGKLVENWVQHLAWTVICDTMVKMRLTNPRWHCFLQVHDELGYIVPESEGKAAYEHLMKFMCQQPSWADAMPYPVPLGAEGGIAYRYSDAK